MDRREDSNHFSKVGRRALSLKIGTTKRHHRHSPKHSGRACFPMKADQPRESPHTKPGHPGSISKADNAKNASQSWDPKALGHDQRPLDGEDQQPLPGPHELSTCERPGRQRSDQINP